MSEQDSEPAAARRARVLAFYLPQFHPVPENDDFWGSGFTEWTHVAAARPLFRGHRQPRLPGALGFYDLRVPETRAAQARLAAGAGIEGFLYWHYWFGDGRRMRDRPFAEVLASGEPDFPFALAWANHSWGRSWTGDDDAILIEQRYPGDDDVRRHFEVLAEAFHDRRYIRVDGRPLFVLHRPVDVPDRRRFAELLRELAVQAGLPGIHLVGRDPRAGPAAREGFDAWIRDPRLTPPLRGLDRVRRAVRRRTRGTSVSRFADFVADDATRPLPPHMHPTLLAGWDNTPRRGRRGTVLHGLDADAFGRHCRSVLDAVRDRPYEQRLVFLKSWNEWAEGNTVEPDDDTGTALLEALGREVHRRAS